MYGRLLLVGHASSQVTNNLINYRYPKQIVGKSLMLSNCPAATKCVYSVSNLWLLSVCLIMVHFFFNGSARVVDKLVMHPCVPFVMVHPQRFLEHPSVHRAHRLKSTAVPLELEKTSPRMLNFGYLNPATCLLYDFNNKSIKMFDICRKISNTLLQSMTS